MGHDGKTAYERNKGKKAKVLGIEFGEAILWKRRPVGGALGKLSCLWEDGLYLGIRGQSGELIVSDREGVWRTRTVQRKPIEDRWPEDAYEMIQKTPWADAEKDEMQGETEKLVTEMTEAEKEAEKQGRARGQDSWRGSTSARSTWRSMATRRIVPGAGRRCGGRPSRSTQRCAELAFSRQWRTMIGS